MKLHALGLRVALSFFLATAACASAQVPAQRQTDVALSVYGAFDGTVGDSVANVSETPTNAVGGMMELRHIVNSWLGFEAMYALNPANQVYGVWCSLCTSPPPVSAYAHAFTGDWVFSSHAAKVRYFALVGVGILYFQPVSSSQAGGSWGPTQSFTTPVYVYGVGFDRALWKHLGLRLQYRGNFYKAPYLLKNLSNNVSNFTHTAEPALGVYYKF